MVVLCSSDTGSPPDSLCRASACSTLSLSTAPASQPSKGATYPALLGLDVGLASVAEAIVGIFGIIGLTAALFHTPAACAALASVKGVEEGAVVVSVSLGALRASALTGADTLVGTSLAPVFCLFRCLDAFPAPSLELESTSRSCGSFAPSVSVTLSLCVALSQASSAGALRLPAA